MSCQSCMLPPTDAYATFTNRIRVEKMVQTSPIRVVYIEKDVYTLYIDGAEAPVAKDDISYFDVESGDKILSLVNRGGKEMVTDIFEFKEGVHYTIVVFEEYILQFEEADLRCPELGTVRLQAYNMDGQNLDVYLDEDLIFENLGKDQFIETVVQDGIYTLRISADPDFSHEIELKSGTINTIFFLFEESALFIVENGYCQNIV